MEPVSVTAPVLVPIFVLEVVKDKGKGIPVLSQDDLNLEEIKSQRKIFKEVRKAQAMEMD